MWPNPALIKNYSEIDNLIAKSTEISTVYNLEYLNKIVGIRFKIPTHLKYAIRYVILFFSFFLLFSFSFFRSYVFQTFLCLPPVNFESLPLVNFLSFYHW